MRIVYEDGDCVRWRKSESLDREKSEGMRKLEQMKEWMRRGSWCLSL